MFYRNSIDFEIKKNILRFLHLILSRCFKSSIRGQLLPRILKTPLGGRLILEGNTRGFGTENQHKENWTQATLSDLRYVPAISQTELDKLQNPPNGTPSRTCAGKTPPWATLSGRIG